MLSPQSPFPDFDAEWDKRLCWFDLIPIGDAPFAIHYIRVATTEWIQRTEARLKLRNSWLGYADWVFENEWTWGNSVRAEELIAWMLRLHVRHATKWLCSAGFNVPDHWWLPEIYPPRLGYRFESPESNFVNYDVPELRPSPPTYSGPGPFDDDFDLPELPTLTVRYLPNYPEIELWSRIAEEADRGLTWLQSRSKETSARTVTVETATSGELPSPPTLLLESEAHQAHRAHREKLFPKGSLDDQDLEDVIIAIETMRDPSNTDIAIVQEKMSCTREEARRYLSRVRKAQADGRTSLPKRTKRTK